MIGPDHAASLEPMGLQRLVRNIRNIEKALGSPEKTMMPAERAVRDRLAKSIVARRDIPAGTKITADMLTVKGPGTGLKPSVIRPPGRRRRRDPDRERHAGPRRRR